MARVREFRFAPVALAREAGIGIRGGLMRVVPSRFPMKVHRRVPRIVRRRRRSGICAAEALETRPRFQQRPIDREVFVREQTRRAGLGEDLVKERGGDVTLKQPV